MAACDRQAPLLPDGAHYVAMGSSFASGPGLPPYQDASPKRCARSSRNYAALLAQSLNLSLTDMTCAGAKTEHILEDWKELDAQIAGLREDTKLVTITIGGNDLGYIGGLSSASCRTLVEQGKSTAKCWPRSLPAASDYQDVLQQLVKIAQTAKDRAPDATIVFVTYFSVLPDGPVCDAAPLTDAQADAYRTIGKELEAITAQAAQQTGSRLLDTAALTRAHHVCAPEPWMHGYWPNPNWSEKAPYHAKAEAMQAVAGALEAMLTQ
ncbi:MAG: SGNH/GDSL hydrolase family protein [Pseudomonadota bacterium]